jgi:1-acyl-sn-glycerol-3-phosphate acyltransferase
MAVAFSLVFWTYFVLSSIALFVGAVVVWALTRPFDRNGRVLHLYTCFWAVSYFYVNKFWTLRFEWRARPPRDEPFVIVSNHQSLGDILVLSGTYLPFKWVSKQSIFSVPLIGWNMRMNEYVALVRGDSRSSERMIADCERWLARGVSVFLFPEGTRSTDGTLRPFRTGAFRIALASKRRVLPVVLDGTGDCLPKHGMVFRKHARVRVRVLEPIDVCAYATPDEARDAVAALFARELAALRGASPPAPAADGARVDA